MGDILLSPFCVAEWGRRPHARLRGGASAERGEAERIFKCFGDRFGKLGHGAVALSGFLGFGFPFRPAAVLFVKRYGAPFSIFFN